MFNINIWYNIDTDAYKSEADFLHENFRKFSWKGQLQSYRLQLLFFNMNKKILT